MVLEKVEPARRALVAAQPAPPRRARARAVVPRLALAAAGVLVAVAVVLVATGSTPFVVAPGRTSGYDPRAVAALMVLFAGGIVAAALNRRPVLPAGLRAAAARVAGQAWWMFVAVCFVAQLALAHAVLQLPDWDAAQIFEVAYHLAVAPEPRLFSVGDQAAYFSLYPNNAFLVAAFALLFGALKPLGLVGMDQYLWAAVVVNCVALTGALVLTRFVVRRLVPGVATIVAVGLGVVLVLVSPWLNVAYSDTLAMVVPIGVLALWLAWPEDAGPRGRALLIGLVGAISGVGLAIKPPAVFMALALLLVAARTADGGLRGNRRRLLGAVVAFAVGLGLAHVGVDLMTRALFPGYSTAAAMPFTHFMAMGSTGDGGFNQADFDRSWALPAGARAKASLFLWVDRVVAMGPVGYPLFLAEKLLYAFSDGTFFQDREGLGPFAHPFLAHDSVSAAVQGVFPLGSPLHWLLASLWQAAWWSAVLLCFVPLKRLRLPRPGAVLAARISLGLLLAFLCISESRSRYLYHFLPVVLVLAGLGAAALVAEIRARADARAVLPHARALLRTSAR